MSDDQTLIPVPFTDVAETLAYALRFRRGRRAHDADDAMAAIVAQRLAEHLEGCGWVMMRRPGGNTHFNPPSSLPKS